MIPRKTQILLLSLFIGGPAVASVTISLGIGRLTSSNSVTLPGDTLWALVSQDSAGNLPGGLGADSSFFASSNTQNIMNDFAGQTITTGANIGGGRVIATGPTTASTFALGEGYIDGLINFDLNDFGLSVGDKLAIYWFPGRTEASNTLPSDTFEIGGFQRTTVNTSSGGEAALIVPPDLTQNVNVFYLDDQTTGASDSGIDQTSFQAIAVPEPSTLMFLCTSLLFLARHRRR